MDVVGSLRKYFLKDDSVSIDNAVFKLHYRATVGILIAFSLLVTSRQYFGDPIDCFSPASAIPNSIMDTYCWISTTFTMVVNPNLRVGIDIPHPGIDSSNPSKDPNSQIYHQYYQWVCFMLFLQAVMFYVPHYLWKIWEGGRIKGLMTMASSSSDGVVKYFRNNLHQHRFYFVRFVFCELLNFANVVGQIYFTNRFLGGAFMSYGVDVIRYSESADQDNRTDPMTLVFPRVTKCIFNTYGASGDVQKHDALCILPINIINEKVYIFLWFYFIILSAISGLGIVYRLLTVCMPAVRFLLLKSRARCSAKEYVDLLIRQFQVGDWFVLYQFGKSADSHTFTTVVAHLAKELNDKDGNDFPLLDRTSNI